MNISRLLATISACVMLYPKICVASPQLRRANSDSGLSSRSHRGTDSVNECDKLVPSKSANESSSKSLKLRKASSLRLISKAITCHKPNQALPNSVPPISPRPKSDSFTTDRKATVVKPLSFISLASPTKKEAVLHSSTTARPATLKTRDSKKHVPENAISTPHQQSAILNDQKEEEDSFEFPILRPEHLYSKNPQKEEEDSFEFPILSPEHLNPKNEQKEGESFTSSTTQNESWGLFGKRITKI
uniref:AlNc14C67G4737 protein n=1 Tax=Albugo laibachii Nc14 TaxID=890382 RepID=F0WDL7_9STRA|nr:AlNc14C67G4737 [Albugo laibachii Nc14]|eukprot:CCA19292.1 AlNc14C67G4737 [Albugo laibachii Nc14]